MQTFEMVLGLLLLALVSGGVLFFIFRDAKRMDKRSHQTWWRRRNRRKAKPARAHAPDDPVLRNAMRGTGH